MLKMSLKHDKKSYLQGMDNLYFADYDEKGDWEVLEEWQREHNCTPILCDFRLIQKNDKTMLIGASANATRWIGKEISTEGARKITLGEMAIFLEA